MFIPDKSKFRSFEFVPPEIYNYFGEELSYHFINDSILMFVVKIRTYFNCRVFINNWYWNGDLENRGFRLYKCDIGATFSQHKFGNAIDFDVDGMTAEEVRQAIIEKQDLFPEITRLESDVSWIHGDKKDTGKKDIVTFSPGEE